MRTRYRAIACVEKTHGRRGEVVTSSVHGLPAYVREGMTLAVVPPALKGPRMLRVVEAGEADPGQLVRFVEVADLDAARALVGKTLLASLDELPADFAAHDRERLVGREVVDAETGERIGIIEEVYAGIANDVWTVRVAHGTTWELPVIDLIVREVSSEGPIAIRPLMEHIIVTTADQVPEEVDVPADSTAEV